MPEPVALVRDFLESGGAVLVAILVATLLMWTFILERAWYFRFAHRREAERVPALWKARPDHTTWNAHQIRRLLVAEVQAGLDHGLPLIRTIVALCPLLGLLGTVTGMIEVFDVMAIAGSGNARAMAAGVSKATIPTMAGMVAALSGVIVSAQMDRFAREEGERVGDLLTPVTR